MDADRGTARPEGAEEPAALARRLLAAHAYMTLATADASGTPWASPVFYATAGDREIYWVSSPDARHSRNLAARPDVAIVIFDSQVPIGHAQAAYLSGRAAAVPAAELAAGVAHFSRGSEARGAGRWGVADVTAPATLRLYRARIEACSVLDAARTAGDWRMPVDPWPPA